MLACQTLTIFLRETVQAFLIATHGDVRDLDSDIIVTFQLISHEVRAGFTTEVAPLFSRARPVFTELCLLRVHNLFRLFHILGRVGELWHGEYVAFVSRLQSAHWRDPMLRRLVRAMLGPAPHLHEAVNELTDTLAQPDDWHRVAASYAHLMGAVAAVHTSLDPLFRTLGASWPTSKPALKLARLQCNDAATRRECEWASTATTAWIEAALPDCDLYAVLCALDEPAFADLRALVPQHGIVLTEQHMRHFFSHLCCVDDWLVTLPRFVQLLAYWTKSLCNTHLLPEFTLQSLAESDLPNEALVNILTTLPEACRAATPIRAEGRVALQALVEMLCARDLIAPLITLFEPGGALAAFYVTHRDFASWLNERAASLDASLWDEPLRVFAHGGSFVFALYRHPQSCLKLNAMPSTVAFHYGSWRESVEFLETADALLPARLWSVRIDPPFMRQLRQMADDLWTQLRMEQPDRGLHALCESASLIRILVAIGVFRNEATKAHLASALHEYADGALATAHAVNWRCDRCGLPYATCVTRMLALCAAVWPGGDPVGDRLCELTSQRADWEVVTADAPILEPTLWRDEVDDVACDLEQASDDL